MKTWQHGYALDYLKAIEAKYAHYNSYTVSPFVKVKKNNVAQNLKDGTLKQLDDNTFINVTLSKAKSKITMHGDTYIAVKEKDDIVLSELVGDESLLEQEIAKYQDNNCWLYVWAEDVAQNALAERNNFCRVGPKITTFGEIFMIYYRGRPRPFPVIDKAEYQSIKKIGTVNQELIDAIANKLDKLPAFTNHYSNYNKNKSWGALSLRGYSSDPFFITKPIEMNAKWQEENKDKVFALQDTELFEQFEEVRELLKPYGDKLHRVRFMRLRPGGGELERHTDQVDPDSGGSLGKLSRLHFPIKTNDDVKFTVWHTDGNPKYIHMQKYECWFLDTRKPHMAINGGEDERIHLVVDLVTEKKLHELIIG